MELAVETSEKNSDKDTEIENSENVPLEIEPERTSGRSKDDEDYKPEPEPPEESCEPDEPKFDGLKLGPKVPEEIVLKPRSPSSIRTTRNLLKSLKLSIFYNPEISLKV